MSAIDMPAQSYESESDINLVRKKSWTRYLKSLGPGLVTGASDNDPSGISTYAVAGARTGYALLWVVLIAIPMMIAVQDMAARVGATYHKGLGQLIADTYGRRWLVLVLIVLIVMNVTTIGADLAGIAAALQMVTGISLHWFILPIAIFIISVEIFWSYRVFSRYVKYLTLVLFAYVIDGMLAGADWAVVARSLVLPKIMWNREILIIAVGILGTTISPYMLFWQASQELEELQQEESVPNRSPVVTVKSESLRLFDTSIGMVYSNLVAFFIILSSAATLHKHGITVNTASEAASALRPIAGDWAYILFAVGIIGSGLIAIPVIAGATAYPLSEWHGCPEGLDKPIHRARCFYSVITASVLVGVVIAFLPINTINALFYSQVLMGLLTPIVLLLLVVVTGNRSVMGKENVNTLFFSIFGWLSVVITMSADIALLWMMLTSHIR